ncbi:hypothetical protein B566_EDAN008942 [Ephemera danica]|nr:hypothetical protein B566_EDAN008942 [Ephemera danica]
MHFLLRTLFVLCTVACLALAFPAPDSAGIVERVNGLAYGGIPYGSVSGALSSYRPAHGYGAFRGRGGPNAGVRVLRPRIFS